MTGGLHLERDPLGSLIHVKDARGACHGCIEAGLFDVVRELLRAEFIDEVQTLPSVRKAGK